MKRSFAREFQGHDPEARAYGVEAGQGPRGAAAHTLMGLRSSMLYGRLPMGQSLRRLNKVPAKGSFEFAGKKIPVTFLTSKHANSFAQDYVEAVSKEMHKLGLKNGHVRLLLARGGDALRLPAHMRDVTIGAAKGATAVYLNTLELAQGRRRVDIRVGVGHVKGAGAQSELVAENLENLRAQGVQIRLRGHANMANAQVRDISFTGATSPTVLGVVGGTVNGSAPTADQLYELTHPSAQRAPAAQVMRGNAPPRSRTAAARSALLQPPEPIHRGRYSPEQLAA